MRLLLAGGGTGGHLFPAVALAQQLLARESGSDVLFVGTERGLEARLLPQLNLPLKTIDIAGFVGRSLGAKLALAPKLWRSFRQSLRIIDAFAPELVIGVGGYASAPVLLAAKWRGIPYLIHEQNAYPGLSNRLLGRWAARVCLSLAAAAVHFNSDRVEVTGNPVRPELAACPVPGAGEAHLLLFGGSLGARALNQAMIAALPLMASWRGRLQITHQTGAAEVDAVEKAYRNAGWEDVRVMPFIDDMARAYADSHLVVCRAGATTVAELSAVGRPAILVPYPHAAADHQTANARVLAEAGAAQLLPQSELNGAVLAERIGNLLENRALLLQMAAAARKVARPGAAERILALGRELVAEKG